MGVRVWEEGDGELVLTGDRVSVLQDENYSEMDGGDASNMNILIKERLRQEQLWDAGPEARPRALLSTDDCRPKTVHRRVRAPLPQ